MRRLAIFAVIVSAAFAISAISSAGASARRSGRPELHLTSINLATLYDQLASITGRVGHAPPGTRVTLQMRSSGRWSMAAQVPLDQRHWFTLRWSTPYGGPSAIRFRVLAISDGRVLAQSRLLDENLPTLSQLCVSHPPQLLPVGYGAIVGGVYIADGTPPQHTECSLSPYAITATNTASGAVAETQILLGGWGYFLVVPAGSYALKSGTCTASATVTAGQLSPTDTACPDPPPPG